MRPNKGDWMLCALGHRAWLAIGDTSESETIRSKDFVDKDGIAAPHDRPCLCPTCGGAVMRFTGFGVAGPHFDPHGIERADGTKEGK